jgi:hypothetical protein
MPAIVWVVGGLAVLVAVLLAVDWFTAGRVKGRMLNRVGESSSQNASVNTALVERQAHATQYHQGNP